MLIRLTKLSDERHRLEVVRDDGSTERVELASRSFVVHDFLHYAIETEAGLRGSFWGLLASGKPMAELAEAMRPVDPDDREVVMSSEPAITEAVVGVLTGVAMGRSDAAAAIDGLRRLFEAREIPLPSWLTEGFVVSVAERMRRLRGAWKAVPYGGAMELTFP